MKYNYYEKVDRRYAKSYSIRNKKKIISINKKLSGLQFFNAIDIGCNQGYVIKNLLEEKIIDYGAGLDIDKSIIDHELFENPNFTFFEENLVDFKFPSQYDIVIFNSVYHHIYANYGKEIALSVWRKIIDNCKRYLFFETAVLDEIGKALYWKESFINDYKDDNHIISELLLIIGDRLEDVQIIGSYEIHCAKRPLYMITLKQRAVKDKSNIKIENDNFEENHCVVEQKYFRTEGSIDQKLILSTDTNKDLILNKDVCFFILRNTENNKLFFSKKRLNSIYKQNIEFLIIKKIEHEKVLRPHYFSEKYGIVFDYLPWKKLSEIDFREIYNKKSFEKEISAYFKYINNSGIHFGNYIDSVCALTHRKRLSEIVDSNINNFLVFIEDREIKDWKVIDFEYSLINTKIRNQSNYLKILNLINGNCFTRLVTHLKIILTKSITYLISKLTPLCLYNKCKIINIFIRGYKHLLQIEK